MSESKSDLVEGSVYHYQDRLWLASFIAGAWLLRLLADDVAQGEVFALRQTGGVWRGCLYAPVGMGEELVFGPRVTFAPSDLAPVDMAEDVAFYELLSELAWEWQ
jgi:hypothetical protein